jgi:beta-lactamase regulating signal transducer with metallopeptidase domain
MEWLLTWLWQGTALVLGVSVCLRVCSRIGASVRHTVWWAAMAGVVALAWTGGWAAGPVAIPLAAVAGAPGPRPVVELPSTPAWFESALIAGWAALVSLGLGRLAASLRTLQAQRRRCEPMPAAREDRLVEWIAARDAAPRRARLMVSDTLPVASVLGLVRPLIVVPRRLVTLMTDRELELVVLHELAHVRRWDDWTRLAQRAIEIVLPFHPAVRWIGRALALEREVACDQWVVSRAGAPKAYAGCLARVAELTAARPAGALAPGIYRSGWALIRRVERLLGPQPYCGRAVRAGSLVAGVLVIGCAVAQFRSLPALVMERQTLPRISAAGLYAAVAPALFVPFAGELPAAPAVTRPAAVHAAGADGVPLRAVSFVALVDVVAELPAAVSIAAPPLRLSLPLDSPASVTASNEPGPSFDGPQRPAARVENPWHWTADAGVAVATGAQQSGLAIASALTRLGRSVGRAF